MGILHKADEVKQVSSLDHFITKIPLSRMLTFGKGSEVQLFNVVDLQSKLVHR